MRLYARRFVEIVGEIEPGEITRAHVLAFRDGLEAKGSGADNVKQHLDKLHTLFNVGLSEGVISTNPAHKIKARPGNVKHADGKQPFTAEHARKIFAALNGETADFQWTMRLLAYHGARSGEICQLRVDDVTVLNSVPVFRVHDMNGSIKNAASVRDIPIHPACKGIVAYAKAVAAKHGSAAWLFQDWKAHRQGRAHRFQDKGGKFLREKVGITDARLTLHCWRHTFRTLCREVEMPESVSRAIMGHTLGSGEHGAYGSAPSLKVRAKWLAKIDPTRG
jgi:integrase